jgi:type IV pilus assembly protein PilA
MLIKSLKRRRSDEGFTLIELLVVVVILGILIGIAIPVYLNYRKSANDKAAQSDLRNAISTLEVCNSDGGYPTAADESTGALTGCDSQTPLKLSSGTKIRYVYAAGPPTSYTIYARNDGGSPKVYCYNSTAGGGVKTASTTVLTTAACT